MSRNGLGDPRNHVWYRDRDRDGVERISIHKQCNCYERNNGPMRGVQKDEMKEETSDSQQPLKGKGQRRRKPYDSGA
jgi:hypothetical protein